MVGTNMLITIAGNSMTSYVDKELISAYKILINTQIWSVDQTETKQFLVAN